MTLPEDVTSSPLPRLAPRDDRAHKGHFGRVLVIGGAEGMAGAPALAGMAALRSGAGLVTVAVPDEIQPTVASYCAAYMTRGVASSAGYITWTAIDALVELAASMDVVALGPGFGRHVDAAEVVRELYRYIECPLVVDADALVALAEQPQLWPDPPGTRILTPHPGEFARFAVAGDATSDADRPGAAVQLAQRDPSEQTIVVLKGHRTVVAAAERYALNATGNPGMATGGTGDCLTGVIAALVGQGLAPFDAARLGTHIHGLAGDLARDTLGEVSLIATDLLDYLPRAFVSSAGRRE